MYTTMNYSDREFTLEVWGDFACFTRPELKVERVSYDVITPSAARAIFEAIFWKPAFKWQITEIQVLNDIKWFSIKRNEVAAVASRGAKEIFIEEKRIMKNGLLLRDVRYRIKARLVYIPVGERTKAAMAKHEAEGSENPMKYYEMFERRARKGQCFTQPYLGCREFSASWRLVEDGDEQAQPLPINRDLGIMLYDMDFSKKAECPDALFYHARIENGTISVPTPDSNEILR